ncbi:glycoside hydrolase family 113 [Ekhidna sp.]
MKKKEILWLLISITASFLLVVILIGMLFISRGASFFDYLNQLPQIIFRLIKEPIVWITLSIPYFIRKLIQYWIRGYRKGKFKKLGLRFTYSFLLPGIAIVIFIKLSNWYQTSEYFDYRWDETVYNNEGVSRHYSDSDQKIRGMHFFGRVDSLKIIELTKGNIEHLILIPYADQKDYNVPMSKLSEERIERRDSSYRRTINVCQKMGIDVIIKPHIWISDPSDGKWRADIWMESEEDWQEWESNYTQFILTYAKLSERFGLPLFCIGNEYYLSTTKRPDYWRSLIRKVRKVYSGKLVYGANWDREYIEILFWDELDYIGIQAYFPLADTELPEYNQIHDGWNVHLKEIQSVSEKFGKEIIFTELGYKSTPDAAQYPWGWENFVENQFQRISTKTQTYCYQAFFEKVWVQDWFAGVMIWQWQSRDSGETLNHYFTVKGKPAFNELAKGFSLELD